jgi:putative exosortase-associated protein (TIGR04073 family)
MLMGYEASLAMQLGVPTLCGKSRFFRRAPALVVLIAIIAATPCWAQAQSKSDAPKAADKALRGLANITTGVMVFPGEIRKNWNEGGPGMGLTVGVAQGLGMIVARELIGVFELLSSPTPWPKENFDPILEPAYPWYYFRD